MTVRNSQPHDHVAPMALLIMNAAVSIILLLFQGSTEEFHTNEIL